MFNLILDMFRSFIPEDFNMGGAILNGQSVTLCLYDGQIIGESGVRLDVEFGVDGPHMVLVNNGQGWEVEGEWFEPGMKFNRLTTYHMVNEIRNNLCGSMT